MTDTPPGRDLAVLPTVAALVVAVADHDAVEVERILTAPDLDWMALAVMLAAHVPEDARIGQEPPMSNRRQLDTAVRFVADAFDTTPAAIHSPSRRRNDADARSVAMAALRWAGHTTSWIGAQLGRDHTTVVHATGRVGEDPRLRAVAHELVDRLGGFHHTTEEVA